MRVRAAVADDRARILAVVETAFTGDGRDGSEELDIVTATWASGAVAFELVALDRDEVIGHLLAARGDLDGDPVVAIAPLAVVPGRQRCGVGTALMTALLAAAEEACLPMVLLLGSPAYYGRFGFEPASARGIVYPPAGPANPAFQVRRLSHYDPEQRGTFIYVWERP